jgi:hypothetical protein
MIQMRLEYVGFVDTGRAREYSLQVKSLTAPPRTFVFAISNDSFAGRHARYQDGPDICYQALAKALAAAPELPADRVALSDEDLYHYRCANAPRTIKRGPAQHGPASPPPRPGAPTES